MKLTIVKLKVAEQIALSKVLYGNLIIIYILIIILQEIVGAIVIFEQGPKFGIIFYPTIQHMRT